MIFTENFRKTLPYLGIACFFIFGVSILRNIFGISSYIEGDKILLSEQLLQTGIGLLHVIVFWGTVGVLTKAKKATAWALAISIISTLYSSWYLYSAEAFHADLHEHTRSTTLVLRLASYLVFGFFYFRSNKALWMGVLFLTGWMWLPMYEYTNVIEQSLGWMGIDYPFASKKQLENGFTTYIDWLALFFNSFHLILRVTIFWMLLVIIRFKEKNSWKLLTTDWAPKLDRLSFSLIYWALHLALFGTMFSENHALAGHLFKGLNPGSIIPFLDFISFLSVILSLYVIGSLYRNFLVSFFTIQETYPTWLYWFLNIPIINFFAWIYIIATPFDNKQNIASTEENDALSPEAKIQKTRSAFNSSDRNGLIKGIFVGLGVLNVLIVFFMGSSSELLTFIPLFFGLAILYWYVYHDVALWVIWPLQCLFIIGLVISRPHPNLLAAVWPIFVAGMINVVVYYGLLHFHEMRFYQETDPVLPEE